MSQAGGFDDRGIESGGLDHVTFQRRLFAWLDGQLPAAEAARMDAYCRAHPDAQRRVEAERAFDARVRAALVADVAGRDVVSAALAKARAAGGGGATSTATAAPTATSTAAATASAPSGRVGVRPAGRLLGLPRWATGVASAAALAVGLMWLNCIPPFECPLLQAMEAASVAPSDGSAELDGRPVETVPADWARGSHVMRTRVPLGEKGDAVVLLCPVGDHLPSFRRRRTIDGQRWWVAFERGRTIVAFEDAGGRGVWCFVAREEEATLLAAAEDFRSKLPRTSK